MRYNHTARLGLNKQTRCGACVWMCDARVPVHAPGTRLVDKRLTDSVASEID